MARGEPPRLAAERIGFTYETVKRHMRADAAFSEAMTDAAARLDDEVVGVLLEKARGGNIEAIKVWLYNRRGDKWKDQKVLRQEISGPGGGPIEIAQANTFALREVLNGHDPDTRERALGLLRSIPVASRDAGLALADGDAAAPHGDGLRGVLPTLVGSEAPAVHQPEGDGSGH